MLALLATGRPALAAAGPELPLPVTIEEQALPACGVQATDKGVKPVPAPPAGVCPVEGLSGSGAPQVPTGAEGGSLTFPDGTVLAVYRQGEGAQYADPFSLHRNQEGAWSEPRAVGRERWLASAGARTFLSLSSFAPRATVAWYTEADQEPRILVSQTPDAGQRWTAAMRADIGRPEGRLSQVTLSDGSILLCWLELPGDDASLPGGLYLRRYAPNGASAMPALLAIVSADQLDGEPLLSLLSDGGDGTAQLRLSFVEQGRPRLLHLALPSRAVLEDLDQSCRCGPAREPGQSLRARILSLDTKAGTAQLGHGPVPGLLRPGKLTVSLPAGAAASLHVGDEVLGRLLGRGGRWELQGLRRLGGNP